jgi:hypothetical protein
MADELRLAGCALCKPDMLDIVWGELKPHFKDTRAASLVEAAWKYRQITRGMLTRDTLAELLEDNRVANSADYLALFDDLKALACTDTTGCSERFAWESDKFRREYRQDEVGNALAVAMETLTSGTVYNGVQRRGPESAVEVFNEIAAHTIAAQTRITNVRTVSFAEEVLRTYNKIAETGSMAIRTGFRALDDLTSGLSLSNLVLVGAYAAEGKSFALLNMAHHAQVTQKLNVAIATGEMSDVEYRSRYLAKHAYHLGYRVPTKKIDRAALDEEQRAALFDVVVPDLLNNPNYGHLHLWQFGRQETIESLMRRVASLPCQIDVLVIDYLSLMSCGKRGRGSRREELEDIIRDAKAAALSAYNGRGILVYTGFQTNRESWKLAQDLTRYTKIAFAETGEAERSADLAFWLLDIRGSHMLKAGVVKYRHGDTLEEFWITRDLDYAHMDCQGGVAGRTGRESYAY